MPYTPSQQQAIDTRDTSILLSAGAGSGKTKVLVERIIKMITEEKISVDELLVVTFTKAAASEMKNRISEALNAKIAAHPRDTYLLNQSLLLNNAAITTIHSFCLDLVRENYYLLGLDANCKVADETESHLLKESALDKYLEFKYQENDPLFRQLLLRYGGRKDEKIRQIILLLYEQAISLPNYENWLKNLGQSLLEPDFWLTETRHKAQKSLEHIISLLNEALKYCQEDEKCSQKYLSGLVSERALLETAALKLNTNLDDFLEYIERVDLFAVSMRANQKEGEYYNLSVDYYKKAKLAFSELQDSLANAHSNQVVADLADIYPFVNYLGRMTLGFNEYYLQEKCLRHLLDFDDMGHLALELLYEADDSPSRLSLELKSRYQAVLIDEYQDTNDLQEKIMLAISRDNNYFMVGDVKQSIYSFRMANPALFQHKYESFPPSQIIDMNKNFRSRENIVNAINDLFTILMPGNDENPDYQATAQMEFGAAYYAKNLPEPAIQVWRLKKADKDAIATSDNDDTDEKNISSADKKGITREAELIAQEILRLIAIKQQVFDKNINDYRPLTFRDIVIIMRAPSNGGSEIFEVLSKFGIPCYLERQNGYFSAWEVQITLDILRTLDNPQQDIPLCAVLRAPFIGFTAYSDAQLLSIRQIAEKKTMYECLELIAEQNTSLGQKATQTLYILQKLRRFATQCPISELILLIYKEFNLLEYVDMLPQGATRRNNLEALYDKAIQYEQASFHGLFMFLSFLEQMQQKNQSIEPAPLIGENVDVVRIMSIHQSKGLEFPIVFLPKIGKKFYTKDYAAEILLDKALGLILPNVDLNERIIYPTICHEVLKERKKNAMLAEEKRILYVAMTRAREHLYFVGQESTAKDGEEKSYLDWLDLLRANLSSCSGIWEFRDFETTDLLTHQPDETNNADVLNPTSNTTIDEALYQSLSWRYPHQAQCYIPTKTSVTAINEQKKLDIHFIQPTVFNRPKFLQNSEHFSATEKGTIMHTIMSQIDLKAQIDLNYLTQLAAKLEYQNILPPNSATAVNLRSIEKFFQTPLGKRLKCAEIVYRERPFTLPIKINDRDNNPCTVLVQGIIDCMWQEGGEWVLLDYKSNYILPADEPQFITNYQAQIDLYANAINEIWHEPLKAAYLYLFYTSRSIELNVRI